MPSKKTKSKTAKEKRQEREKEILSRTVEREQALREMEKHVKASSKATAALDAVVKNKIQKKDVTGKRSCGAYISSAEVAPQTPML
jgi:hypothetical protein